LIEGDGIGPEIAVAVKDIFAAAKVCRQLPLAR
jgi:isocitrate/isopropylmalate dehydrogenase